MTRIKSYLFSKWALPKTIDEKISKSVLKRYVPKNPVILDCGAYDGTDSIELLQTLGGRVHSFEAVTSIYDRLNANTKGFKNIETYNCALSDSDGEQKFYISDGSSDASSSLLKPKEHLNDHPTTFFKDVSLVKAITLDTWAKQYNITKVDVLWLDMQGYEMNMLKASTVIFPMVTCIHTEVSLKETYLGVKQYAELKNWLITQGFCVQVEAIPAGWDMGNVLFVRKKMKKMGFLKNNLWHPLLRLTGKVSMWYEAKFVIPPYSEKRAVILSYMKKFNSNIFVESGTFMGETVDVMKDYFERLYSVELAPQLAEKAKRRFNGNVKIQILEGNSSEKIKEILPEINSAAIFWLDGHYSGEFYVGDEFVKTAKADLNTPILAELTTILSNGIANNVVLIDDARLFNGTNDYPTYKELIQFLGTFNIAPAQVENKRDIIRIVPLLQHFNR